MQRFHKIFFATDFSDCADHAQTYAFALAKRFGSHLDIGHVIDTAFASYAGVYGFGGDVDLHLDEVKQHAQDCLVGVTDLAREQGIDAHPHLLAGRPAEAIVEKAQTGGSGLIVIGTHGRSGFDHLLFGSTCERVVRFSVVPVLSVKSSEKEFVHGADLIRIDRVLCPCDFSEISEQAVALAAEMCRLFDSELRLIHVVDSRAEYPMLLPEAVLSTSGALHDQAVKRLERLAARQSDLKTAVEVVTGVPHRAIARSAVENDADLVVMTTHGRRRLPLALIGGVAEKIVRSVPAPVLTARPVQKAEDKVHGAEGVGEHPNPATA